MFHFYGCGTRRANDGLSKNVRAQSSRLLLLLAVATALSTATTAVGRTIYRGIGNDEFRDDIDTLAACLKPHLASPYDLDLRVKDKSGAEICALVQADAILCQPGDIYIFHYSGHGSFQPDNTPGEDPNGDDETIGLSGTGLTDDELAGCMKNFADCCTVLVIMDSCFGGGFVGGTEDLDRPSIAAKDSLSMLATADKQCTAPGESILLQRLCDALALTPSQRFAADSNLNRIVTMTEWFSYAAADSVHIQSYYDWDPEHDAYALAIPTVSEWGLVVLALLVFTTATIRLSSRHRRVAT